jgi:hypothetical protein
MAKANNRSRAARFSIFWAIIKALEIAGNWLTRRTAPIAHGAT